MEPMNEEQYQAALQRLNKAAIALAVLVALQLGALERVLRGWQAHDANAVYSGIGASALCFVVAMVIFWRSHARRK